MKRIKEAEEAVKAFLNAIEYQPIENNESADNWYRLLMGVFGERKVSRYFSFQWPFEHAAVIAIDGETATVPDSGGAKRIDAFFFFFDEKGLSGGQYTDIGFGGYHWDSNLRKDLDIIDQYLRISKRVPQPSSYPDTMSEFGKFVRLNFPGTKAKKFEKAFKPLAGTPVLMRKS